MNAMERGLAPETLLLDTCVWLDDFLGGRERSADARRLITRALERGMTLLYAASSVKDVHYIVCQTLKRERRLSGGEVSESTSLADSQTAWACVKNMSEIATAVGMDASDVWLAEKYRTLHGDIEDNLVIAAAQRAHADILVTDDLDLVRHAPVAAMTPGDVLALLDAEEPGGFVE